MKARYILAAIVAASLFAACAGAPKAVPEDLSARELVQRAQEASDLYKYDVATVYYKALGERFGDDPLYKATADYEIAFMAYKKGKYAAAKEGFEGLLARYAGPEGASMPPRFAILSKKVLDTIAEKTKPKLKAKPKKG
jgi:outer membrane protein assembly factor BamD (BamD/ComL family)